MFIQSIVLQWVFPIAGAVGIAAYVLCRLFPKTIAATVGASVVLATATVYLAFGIGLVLRLPEYFGYSVGWGLLAVLGIAAWSAPLIAAFYIKPATSAGQAPNKGR